MLITAKWLRLWMFCFQQNTDFEAYCVARRDKDESACQDLEGRFDRIMELYADWGNIHLINARSSSDSFAAWKNERHHLFYRSSLIRWIEDPNAYVHSPGRFLLDVPFAEHKADTLKQLNRYVDFVYKMRDRAAHHSTKPVARLVNLPLPAAKYSLHGDFNKATRGRVTKAIYVAFYRYKQIQNNGKPLSTSETVLAIKQDPKNPLGWKMLRADESALSSNAFKKHLFAGSGTEITLLKRHRKDFAALVRNTIYGRFPDFT